MLWDFFIVTQVALAVLGLLGFVGSVLEDRQLRREQMEMDAEMRKRNARRKERRSIAVISDERHSQ